MSVLVNHSFQSRAFSTAVANIAPKWLLNHPFCLPNVDQQTQKENKQQDMNSIKVIKSFIKSSAPSSYNNNSPRVAISKPEINPQENEKGQLMIRIVYTFIVLLISLVVKRLKLLFKLTSPLISSSLVYTIPGTMLFLMGILYTPKNKPNERKLDCLAVLGVIMVIIGISCTSLGLYTFITFKQ